MPLDLVWLVKCTTYPVQFIFINCSSTRLACSRGASPEFPITRRDTLCQTTITGSPFEEEVWSFLFFFPSLFASWDPNVARTIMETVTGREDVVHPEVRAHINSLVSAVSRDGDTTPRPTK